MTPRPLALAALLVAAPALAGCAAMGGDSCRDPYPLVLQGYVSVMNDSLYQLQSALWACQGKDVPLDEPCDGTDGLLPRLVIGNETYHLGHRANFSAVPREAVECPPITPYPFAGVLPAGRIMEQTYRWDGTIRPAGAAEPVPVPPGTYVFHVEAGPYYASHQVTIPWPART